MGALFFVEKGGREAFLGGERGMEQGDRGDVGARGVGCGERWYILGYMRGCAGGTRCEVRGTGSGCEAQGARRRVRRGRGVKSARRGERGAGAEGWYILGYMRGCDGGYEGHGYDEGAGYEARVRRGRGVA